MHMGNVNQTTKESDNLLTSIWPYDESILSAVLKEAFCWACCKYAIFEAIWKALQPRYEMCTYLNCMDIYLTQKKSNLACPWKCTTCSKVYHSKIHIEFQLAGVVREAQAINW